MSRAARVAPALSPWGPPAPPPRCLSPTSTSSGRRILVLALRLQWGSGWGRAWLYRWRPCRPRAVHPLGPRTPIQLWARFWSDSPSSRSAGVSVLFVTQSTLITWASEETDPRPRSPCVFGGLDGQLGYPCWAFLRLLSTVHPVPGSWGPMPARPRFCKATGWGGALHTVQAALSLCFGVLQISRGWSIFTVSRGPGLGRTDLNPPCH